MNQIHNQAFTETDNQRLEVDTQAAAEETAEETLMPPNTEDSEETVTEEVEE